MSLLSVLVVLEPEENVTLPGNLGRATHAWFLRLVQQADPGLAEWLHEPAQERPFTVSNVWGAGMPTSGLWNGATSWKVSPGQRVYVRLTSYSPRLTTLLKERVLPELTGGVTWGGARLAIKDVAMHPDKVEETVSVWVGETTFQALLGETLHRAHHVPRVTLRFASPTVFKSRGHFMPLPLPRLVFEGLLRRWNAFSPVRIHEDAVRYADTALAIAYHRLHTEQVRFGEEGERGAMPGFVGRCTYVMRIRDRYWMGVIHTLARFALYSGVGKRTSMGLGQTRVA